MDNGVEPRASIPWVWSKTWASTWSCDLVEMYFVSSPFFPAGEASMRRDCKAASFAALRNCNFQRVVSRPAE